MRATLRATMRATLRATHRVIFLCISLIFIVVDNTNYTAIFAYWRCCYASTILQVFQRTLHGHFCHVEMLAKKRYGVHKLTSFDVDALKPCWFVIGID